MTHGRTAPPRQPSRMTVGELANFTIAHPGLWLLCYAHDDWCSAQRTQRQEDCTCNPDVTLRSYDGTLSFEIVGGA